MNIDIFSLANSKQPSLSLNKHQFDSVRRNQKFSERLNFSHKSEKLGYWYSPSKKCNDLFHTSNNTSNNRRGSSSKGLRRNPVTTRQFYSYCDSNNPVIPRQFSDNDKYFIHRVADPLLLLEHVKNLLQQGNINNARRTLELGSIRYPWSRQILKLMMAIAPGQVLRTGEKTSGRKKEFKWIREHGDKYRGQWVALDGDDLIGFAPTLKNLLAKASSGDQQGRPIFVHYLMPE